MLRAACIARLRLGFAWHVSLSLRRSASLGFARLWSLGFIQLSFAQLALLSSRCFAQPCILACCSHHWLPSLSLGRLASARVTWLALLGSRREPSVTRLCLTCVAGWLASLLACFAGITGSLAGADVQLSLLGTLLGLASLCSASHRWLAFLACCLHCCFPLLGWH